MSKYHLEFTKKAARKYKKLTSKNKNLQEKVQEVFKILIDNPFHSKLKTHKVQITSYGTVYSSRITEDLRIIWELEKERITTLNPTELDPYLQISSEPKFSAVFGVPCSATTKSFGEPIVNTLIIFTP